MIGQEFGSARTSAGVVTIRSIDDDHPRPASSSTYDDWGDMAPEARTMTHERWLVERTDAAGNVTALGDMSAHAVWNGPTLGSRAYSIGISLIEDVRGQGVGAIAQRLLAEELHGRGVVRVEASTDVENLPEQRALAKAGFVLEGVARCAQARRDGLHDLQVWSHVVTTATANGESSPTT